MVWKSERWQTSVEKADLHGDSKVEPGTLEISYGLPGKGVAKELVYQDTAEADGGPRLLVSLASVMKLKGLCEHEHAKHDKALTALKVCRLKYWKEIRWLRDQLLRATGKEGDVFWFDPEEGSDLDGLQNHMLKALQEDNERLKDENAALNEELSTVRGIVDEMSTLKDALRTLLKSHGVREVTMELRGVLAKANHLTDFIEVLRELIPDLAQKRPSGPDPEEFARLGEELMMMRRRSEADEQGLAELRQQADQLRGELQAKASELRSERERADLERSRADEMQKRVEQMDQAIQKRVSQDMEQRGDADAAARAAEARAAEAAARAAEEVSGLRLELSGGARRIAPIALRFVGVIGRLGGGGNVAPAAPNGSQSDLGGAIAHLDTVATSVEDGVQRVLSELQELRLRTQEQDEEIRELKKQNARGVSPSAGHKQVQELQDRINRLEEHIAELQRTAEDGTAQDMQRRELVETLRMEACELRQRFGEKLSGLEGERSRLQRKVDRLEVRLRELASAVPTTTGDFDELVEEDEEIESMPTSISPPASVRMSAREKWYADRPRMVLAEDDAAAALAFLGSGADKLQRVISTCVQVRRFMTPSSYGHRETWSGRGSQPVADMASGRSSSPKRRSVDGGPASSRHASSEGFVDGPEVRGVKSKAAWKPGGLNGAKEEIANEYMSHGPYDSPKHKSEVSHKSSWKPGGVSASGAKLPAQGSKESMFMSHGPYEAPAQRSRSEKPAAWKPGGAGAKDLSLVRDSPYLSQGPYDARAQRSSPSKASWTPAGTAGAALAGRQPPRRTPTGGAALGEASSPRRRLVEQAVAASRIDPEPSESRRPAAMERGRSADALPQPGAAGRIESRSQFRRRTAPAIAEPPAMDPVTAVTGRAMQSSPPPARPPAAGDEARPAPQPPQQAPHAAPALAVASFSQASPQASQDGAPQRQASAAAAPAAAAPAAAARTDAAQRAGLPQARQASRRAAPAVSAAVPATTVLFQADFSGPDAVPLQARAPRRAASRSRSQNRSSRERTPTRSKSPTPPSVARMTITGGGPGGWQGVALPRRKSPGSGGSSPARAGSPAREGSPARGGSSGAANAEAGPFGVPALALGRAPSPPLGQRAPSPPQPLAQAQLRRQPAAPAGPAGPAAAAMQALQQGAALLPGAAPALQALHQALQGASPQQGTSPPLSWSRRSPEGAHVAVGAARHSPLQGARGQQGQLQRGRAVAEPREVAQGQWLDSSADWKSRRGQRVSMFTNTARAPGGSFGFHPGVSRSAPTVGVTLPSPVRPGHGSDRKLPALSPTMRAAMGNRRVA